MSEMPDLCCKRKPGIVQLLSVAGTKFTQQRYLSRGYIETERITCFGRIEYFLKKILNFYVSVNNDAIKILKEI